MKKFLIVCCGFALCISCSRRTVPSKPNYSFNNDRNNSGVVRTDSTMDGAAIADSSTIVSSNAVSIIADGFGRLITPHESLPQNAGIEYNNLQLSKGFTTQQRANLQARYHTLPPRVLYVPQELSSSSLKGSYYVYKNKFWYWKKSDGLYYLDQKYYL
ncbi:MAG: hypothetical protein ABJB05_02400 [Parafilimonas sp.]